MSNTCLFQDITRLSHAGLTVHPITIQRKLKDWETVLDKEVISLKEAWESEAPACKKFQLIGDNWDKNILPSYRTSDRKTMSLHLFNIYAIVDRYIPTSTDTTIPLRENLRLENTVFLPSNEEQDKLVKELCFLFSSSVIRNQPELQNMFHKIYPKHLPHRFSDIAGLKTKQVLDRNNSLTLFVIIFTRNLGMDKAFGLVVHVYIGTWSSTNFGLGPNVRNYSSQI